MSKFLDIIMPVGGGIGGGVVGVMEGSNKIQLLAVETMSNRFVEMASNILTLLPTMIIGAIVGWAVKKTCDYLFNKYTKNGKNKKKTNLWNK